MKTINGALGVYLNQGEKVARLRALYDERNSGEQQTMSFGPRSVQEMRVLYNEHTQQLVDRWFPTSQTDMLRLALRKRGLEIE